MSRKEKGKTERIYERFLELPVPVVLVTLWLMGVVLVSLITIVLYLFWASLRLVAGI